MKRFMLITIVAVLVSMGPILAKDARATGQFGGGIHYLRSLEDIKDSDEFDENSIGFLGAMLLGVGGMKADLMIEYIPDYVGLDEALIMPQAYLLMGQLVYGGVGVGWGYYDGEWFDDPFYALRAGAAIDMGGFGLDVFATYRFQKWDTLEGLDSDDWNSITFGALVRF